jgi:hypothetical protein
MNLFPPKRESRHLLCALAVFLFPVGELSLAIHTVRSGAIRDTWLFHSVLHGLSHSLTYWKHLWCLMSRLVAWSGTATVSAS